MLSGIRVYSSDDIWRQILAELNADVTESVILADVNLDELNLQLPIRPIKLKSIIMGAIDSLDIVAHVLGNGTVLPRLPSQIITWLYKTGGMTASDLKVALGYARDATTHTVDTAICGLRKEYGHDFIVNDNGVYKLGRI